MQFIAGFLIGGGVAGALAFIYGKRVGLALYQVTANVSAASKDLKKGL